MASSVNPAPNPADERVLTLFEAAGQVPTPAPGTMAWLANDPSNDRRPVLIKRMTSGGSAGKGRATEALTLHHPHIVRTRRWLAEGGCLYIVRDVVRGKSLRQTITALPTPPDGEQLRRYLLPVFDALGFAHGRGVAHGGISADNILVAEDGTVLVSDWGTADPRSPQHLNVYKGAATVGGDVKALSELIAAYLPTRGAFASPVVRGRIEGVLHRCETLATLRDTFDSLERIAASPFGRPLGAATAEDLTHIATPAGIPPAEPLAVSRPAVLNTTRSADAPILADTPLLSTEVEERTPFIQPGGGGSAILTVRNEGTAPLVIRMIATQHAWLNVRPVELPLTIPPGSGARLAFAISAARLTPGEYRSEVYLSANAGSGGGRAAEDLRGGWFKHTSEIRANVGAPPPGAAASGRPGGGGSPSVAGGGTPPFPADSPRLPAAAGCAAPAALAILFGLSLSLSALFRLFSHLPSAIQPLLLRFR